MTALLPGAIVVWPTPTAGYVIPAAGPMAMPAACVAPGQSVVFVNADGSPLEGVVFLQVECSHKGQIAGMPTTGGATCLGCGKFFGLGEPRP